jgi:hypothetical protein
VLLETRRRRKKKEEEGRRRKKKEEGIAGEEIGLAIAELDRCIKAAGDPYISNDKNTTEVVVEEESEEC